MKQIKVSESQGAALDWAVWKCAGGIAAYPKTASGPAFLKLWKGNSAKYVHPSTDWAHGGPIIERERICVQVGHDGVWLAYTMQNYADERENMQSGTGPLIAAMRTYVTSKLGKNIELPEELQ